MHFIMQVEQLDLDFNNHEVLSNESLISRHDDGNNTPSKASDSTDHQVNYIL